MIEQPERPKLEKVLCRDKSAAVNIRNFCGFICLAQAKTKRAALKQAARRLRSLANEAERMAGEE